MALTIVDSTSTLLITDGKTVYAIPKTQCFPKTVNGTDFFISDGIGWPDFTLVQAPSGAGTAAELVVLVEAFLDTGGISVVVTSVVPGTGPTNLGKAVGNAGGATDTGVAFLGLRDDVLTTLPDPDGDYVRARLTSVGALWVALGNLLSSSAETADEDADPLLTDSVMYGFDSEGPANSRLRAIQVAVDNASISATPNVVIVGGIRKSTPDTYGDNDAVPFHFDVAGSLYSLISDGTTTASVLSESTETANEAVGVLQTVSAIYGFDSEGSSSLKLRSLQVAVDNASISATPNVLVVGGIHKDANDTYDDNDAVPDHYDAQGAKHVTAQIPTAEYKSPNDLTAVFTSNTTITLSGLSFDITDDSQIVYIRFVPSGGSGARVLVNGLNGVTITESSKVLTVNGVGTPFSSGDLLEVGINGPTKATDLSLDVRKIIEQAPLWARFTSTQAVISSAQAMTTSAADVGSEIPTDGYRTITFFMTTTINSANDFRIAFLAKHESGGAEETPLDESLVSIAGTTVTAPSTAAIPYFEQTEDVNADWTIRIDLNNSIPFLQLQAHEGTDGGADATIDTLDYVLGY